MLPLPLWHPEAQHAKPVEADEHRAAFVGDNPDRQQQTESECGDDKDDDHAQREAEVLVNDPPGVPAEGEGEDDILQVVAHQNDVGGLHRDVCAGCPHGDADRCCGQRWGVVHAVADHCDGADCFQFFDHAHLVFGDSAISYASVYPLTMLLRITVAQVLVILMAG